MAPETLIFMPNGDLTLTLIRYAIEEVDVPSSTSLTPSKASVLDVRPVALVDATIDEDNGQGPVPDGADEAPEELGESALYFAPDPPEGINGPLYPPPPRARRGSNASSRRDRSISPPASFWASLRRQAANVIEVSEDEQAETNTPPMPTKIPERIVGSSHEVHCVVSSRHMMLASQYFQGILSGNFSEAITLRTTGHARLALSDDLDAMIILLNIIHGASRKVPRQVSVEMLSKLAVLVSKFEVLETVGYFSDTWIDGLRIKGFPTSYGDQVITMIFVFWAFDRPSEFKDMTRLAQRECNEKLDEDVRGVPISPSIIDAIKRGRVLAISTAATAIHTVVDRYMAGQTICDGSLDNELRYACDSMVLGSLINSSRKIGIWPIPEAPFNGRNFKDLARAIRTIRILDVCNKSSNRRWNSHGPSSNCHGLEDAIEVSIKCIEAGLDGLELSDYVGKSEDYNSGFEIFPVTSSINELKEDGNVNRSGHLHIYNREKLVEEPKAEVRISQREHSALESIVPMRIDSTEREEATKEQTQTIPALEENAEKLFKAEDRESERAVSWIAEVPSQQQEVEDTLSHHATRFQASETRALPRHTVLSVTVQEHDKTVKEAIPRDPPDQKSKLFLNLMAKIVDEPPNKEVKQTVSRDMNVFEHQKLYKTPSFPQVTAEDIKSPLKQLQMTPRVGSIEEMIEGVLHPVIEDVITPTLEVKESPNTAIATIEAEETRTAPKNFKMRKSKKTFSARY